MAEDGLEDIAGDYVLGTLTAAERRDFSRRLARDPLAAAAVHRWEQRLAPLALAVPPIDPPSGLQRRIMAALGPAAANDDHARPWQLATLAASLVALVATGLALRPHTAAPSSSIVAIRPIAYQPTAIAALSSDGVTPGLFVTFDRASRRMRIVPVGLTPDQAHSYQLWLIEGAAAPKAMGLVDPGRASERAMGAGVMAGTLAISREPLGGSPTGAPTGPVLLSGMLVRLPPST